jgi:bacterial surface protein 26-residue repeat/bacterial surface protein 26-residue repeat
VQDYREVLPSNTVREARDIWNNSLNTLRSTHAGEAFPTENLVLGMKCFRSDEKKTYTLVSLDPVEWKVEAAGKEKLDREEIASRLEFMAALSSDLLKRIPDWTGVFNRALSLELVDFADFGTGWNVTNMSMLFHECMSLTAVLNFKIPQECPVKDVHGMFSKCTKLSALDAAGFQAKNVEDFVDMFSDCHELSVLDVSKWQMGRAINMRGMFRNCWKLESLDVSKWDVSKCTNFAEMFAGCRRVCRLDFTAWDTSKAKAMGGMFQGCGNETVPFVPLKLDLTMLDISNVETTVNMFAYARAELTIGEKMRKTGKCKHMEGMFYRFNNLGDVVIAGAGYNPAVMATDYRGTPCKQTIFTAFDYASVENMSGMFEGTYTENCEIDGKKGLVFHVSTPNVTDISNLFASSYGAAFIDFSMNMGHVCDIRYLFNTVPAESIRLRNFDTRNVGSYKEHVGHSYVQHSLDTDMFKNCRNLRYLIIDSTQFIFKLTEDILADLPAECRFVVPRAMIQTYKAQNIWKDYASRFIAMEDCRLYGAYVKSAPA